MQPHHQATSSVQGIGALADVHIVDSPPWMEQMAPILLLAVVILVARWLTRRPRREAQGR